jgi:hypothetical protein
LSTSESNAVDERLNKIIETFKGNVKLVYELMEFDRDVQDRAISILKAVQAAVGDDLKYSAQVRLSNGIQSLENVRTNDSLRRHYEHILNQCVVLLVSYFDSAVRSVFGYVLQAHLDAGAKGKLLETELKLTVNELSTFSKDDIVETFIMKSDISFQDMQSIARAFRDYVGFEPTKNANVNDIILGHACRHVIVHAGSAFDRKALAQVKSAIPRTLKPNVEVGQTVTFSSSELRRLGEAMEGYIQEVADGGMAAVQR